KLPQFPLPTHDVVVRYGVPNEFERNTVAYDEGQPRKLEKAVVLLDTISDLPDVKNDEVREEMSYKTPPQTEFQKYIRSSEYGELF
ncbi:DNA (cytosine-5)-methyltransferase CMT2, partial [Thalictrum thalictroides]